MKDAEENLIIEENLVNPINNYRISITDVRMHNNRQSFFLSCSNGYLFLFDMLAAKIKKSIKVCPSSILSIILIKEDTEVVALCKNGNIAVFSSLNLTSIFLYQSYH